MEESAALAEAAARHDRRRAAAVAQREHVCGIGPADDLFATIVRNFLPAEDLPPHFAAVASYVEPGDVLVDVGDGAGRWGLPLAGRCREVINVEPSPSMAAAFEEARDEAGIANARLIPTGWLDAGEVRGDLVLAAHVTYFVPEIVPFVRKLDAAARRRVLVLALSVPSPSQDTPLFEAFYGVEREDEPSYRELLPVLWAMGLLPDVRVLGPAVPATLRAPLSGRDAAIAYAMSRLCPRDAPRARAWVEARFDQLFVREGGGYRPTWRVPAREILITWETGGDAASDAGRGGHA